MSDNPIMADDLVERLQEREAKHREVIANSQAVVDALADQMERFNKRDGSHNTYAVRLCVDHESSIRTTTKEADELKEARARITADAAELDRLRAEVEGLREALKPFANYRGSDEYLKSAEDEGLCAAASFNAGDYRRARQALGATHDAR